MPRFPPSTDNRSATSFLRERVNAMIASSRIPRHQRSINTLHEYIQEDNDDNLIGPSAAELDALSDDDWIQALPAATLQWLENAMAEYNDCRQPSPGVLQTRVDFGALAEATSTQVERNVCGTTTSDTENDTSAERSEDDEWFQVDSAETTRSLNETGSEQQQQQKKKSGDVGGKFTVITRTSKTTKKK